jgi:hypothetical protein
MSPAEISGFFERDLLKLKEEISMYDDEKSVWMLTGGISNSGGTLCLHLCGNLLHFIGATLGNSGYVRDRDKEFSLRNIPRRELIAQIDHVYAITKSTLVKLTEEDMKKNFPLEKHGTTVSTVHMLLHLMAHLGYHLGQINYHRRLLSRNNKD